MDIFRPAANAESTPLHMSSADSYDEANEFRGIDLRNKKKSWARSSLMVILGMILVFCFGIFLGTQYFSTLHTTQTDADEESLVLAQAPPKSQSMKKKKKKGTGAPCMSIYIAALEEGTGRLLSANDANPNYLYGVVQDEAVDCFDWFGTTGPICPGSSIFVGPQAVFDDDGLNNQVGTFFQQVTVMAADGAVGSPPDYLSVNATTTSVVTLSLNDGTTYFANIYSTDIFFNSYEAVVTGSTGGPNGPEIGTIRKITTGSIWLAANPDTPVHEFELCTVGNFM